jgi:hypothetical protein
MRAAAPPRARVRHWKSTGNVLVKERRGGRAAERDRAE